MIDKLLNPIKNLILLITYIFCIYLIINELYNLTKFTYNYNYYYNYGNILKKIAKNNNTEFETPRYQVYSNIDKYILQNDYYNSNYNLFILIFVAIITFIIILSFAVIFYYTFDLENAKTLYEDIDDKIFIEDNNQKKNIVDNFFTIRGIVKCFCGDICLKNFTNCFMYNTLFYSILLIFPVIVLLKIFMNIDIYNNNFLYSIFLILFIIIFILRIPIDLSFYSTRIKDTFESRISVIIYYIYIIIIVALIYYLYYLYNNYLNSQSLNGNLYDKDNNYFYDIYSGKKPVKPIEIDINDYVINFKFLSKEDYEKLDYNQKNVYNNNMEKMKKYKYDKEEYVKNLNMYNKRMNLINNINYINDNSYLNIITDLFKNLIGFNIINPNILYFISILIVLIFFYYLYVKKSDIQEGTLFYNTIILSTISLILILLVSNSITIYNTYINRYLIYEPISNYKNDLFMLNYEFNNFIQKYSINSYDRPYEENICKYILKIIFQISDVNFNNIKPDSISIDNTDKIWHGININTIINNYQLTSDIKNKPNINNLYKLIIISYINNTTINNTTIIRITSDLNDSILKQTSRYEKYKILINNITTEYSNLINKLKNIIIDKYILEKRGESSNSSSIPQECLNRNSIDLSDSKFNKYFEDITTNTNFTSIINNSLIKITNYLNDNNNLKSSSITSTQNNQKTLINQIISNYNILNKDNKYDNKNMINLNINYEKINDKLIDEKESNRVLSNSNIVNYAIFLLFVIFILLLLEPIYIDT